LVTSDVQTAHKRDDTSASREPSTGAGASICAALRALPAGTGSFSTIANLLPGIVLSLVITLISLGLQSVEVRTFDHQYIEALVIAIVLGMAVRAAWQPSARWRCGIAFSAKQILEVAVALLGASISFSAIAASGITLLSAIVVTVAIMLASTYGISRLLGLPVRLSILIACGNSICGNSAIAAVARIIGADNYEIVSSISFSAILGVVIVLGLPLLIPLLGLSPTRYGVLAGLTVYSVPQVLAATAPAGLMSVQIGTLVKLVRVLTLGPILLVLSMFGHHLRGDTRVAPGGFRFLQIVPWFIVGFLVMTALRSFQLIADRWVTPLLEIVSFLTVISMAALGLEADVRVVRQLGGRITAAVTLSLALLLLISLAIVHLTV
jgi:uncharacterized integral membrane protein (TIGR00698 family)